VTAALRILAGLCALTLARVAEADPVALRVPVERQRVLIAALGVPEMSVGWWFSERFALSAEWRLPASAAGASLGTRWTLLGEPRGWGVDANLAVGVLIPLIEPGAAVSVTPSILGRWRGDHVVVGASVVAPIVARVLPSPDLRLPVLFEVWLGGHIARWRAGVHGAVGSTWVPGLSWSGTFQGTLYVGYDL
jgi:hypothetical protein